MKGTLSNGDKTAFPCQQAPGPKAGFCSWNRWEVSKDVGREAEKPARTAGGLSDEG